MADNIVAHFEGLHLREIELSSFVPVAANTPARAVVGDMAAADSSCAFVMVGDETAGVFTERDVALKVARQPEVWDEPVDNVMTPDPFTVSADATAMDALRLMNSQHFRNLPVVEDKAIKGNLTHYDLIRLASTYLADRPINHEPTPENSLLFVNFTGILLGQPVTFTPDATLASVIDTMTSEGTGLATIVNDRGAVVGEFSEHDIFTKIACKVTDLAEEVVGDWMTAGFAGVSPRTAIAEGIHLMAEMEHRYLVMISETGHPTGIATFRDISAYFEAAFAV